MTQSSTRSLRRTLLCLAAVFAPLTLPAATINVPSTGTPNIQSGIDAASPGDTVLVAPGTYYENIDFKGKAIAVTSRMGTAAVIPGGADTTIIDGGNKGPVVTFANGEKDTSLLVGFTIRNGGTGNGISIQNGGNYVTAGVLVLNSSPIIRNNTITKNNCYGVLIEQSSPYVQNNIISYTDGTAGAWCGYVAIGTGVLVDGALSSNASSETPIYPTISGNVIENNTQETEDASSSGGGGIHVLTGHPYILANVIRNNFSQQSGGGIAVSNFNPDFDTAYIVGNLIYNNSSACAGGGLAFNQNTAAGYGAPVYFIYNNTIVDNTNTNSCKDSQHADGSQVYLWQDSNRFVFVNNIIAGNSGTFSAFYCETMRQQLPQYQLAIFDHNDFYNSQGAAMTGHCLNPAGDFYGNISVDPLFTRLGDGDYHLAASSPAIDAGNNAAVYDAGNNSGVYINQDLDGHYRQQDVTGIGFPTVDMGVYEYPQTTAPLDTPILVSMAPVSYTYKVGDLSQFNIRYTKAGSPYTLGEGYIYEDDKFSFGGSINLDGTLIIGHTELNPGLHDYVAKLPRYDGLELATSIKIFLIIDQAATSSTTTLTSSANPATVGQSVTFTASVTSPNGTPTGTVNFTDGTSVLGTSALVNGVASFTTSALAIGTHAIAAAYNPGATAFGTSTGNLSQVINGLSTSTSLSVAPTTALYGAGIVMTSTVNLSGSPNSTGGISFLDGTTVIVTGDLLPGSSTTSVNYAYLTVGTHSITAVYSGDATHAASTSPAVIVTITSAVSSLTLSATPNPAFALQPFTISAKLAGLPAGASGNTITFLANGSAIGTAPTSAQGVATFTAALPSGTYTLTAVFAGATGVSAATSPSVTEIVNPNPTTAALFAQPNPGYQGGNETLTASVRTLFASSATPPIPVGTVAFFDSGTLIGTANLDARGQATFSTNAFTVGRHALTANYLGTPNFLPATSVAYTLAILPRDFTLTTDPTINIQTQNHKDLDLTLSSIGDFIDTIALGCANLPAYATCTFPNNSQLLVAGATQTSSVHVDTDALLNYISSNGPASHPQDSPRSGRGAAYGLLLPVTLIAALRRRRKLRRAMGICIGLSVLVIATTFTGCSGHYPGHTPPGTYTFTVTGQGVATHITHSATVTLIVTE